MLELDATQRQVDHLTLTEELKIRGQLAAVGGPAYLMTLDQVRAPSPATRSSTREIVKDQALRRRLANVGREIIELASQETGDAGGACSTRPSARSSTWRRSKREGDLRPVRELMERTLDLLDKMKASTAGVTGLSTGYVDLDMQLTGLHPGELIILAARPGIGKTSLAMNIAMHVALKEEKAVGIFSPGNARGSAADASAGRARARGHEEAARRAAHAPRRGEVPGGRRERCSTRRSTSTTPARLSPFDLRAKARRLKQKDSAAGAARHRLPPADAPEGQGGEPPAGGARDQPLAQALAKELEVPIIALSQLNRKVEERKGGKPMLVGPARVRRHRAGRGRGDVHPPRGQDEDGDGEEARPGRAAPSRWS